MPVDALVVPAGLDLVVGKVRIGRCDGNGAVWSVILVWLVTVAGVD